MGPEGSEEAASRVTETVPAESRVWLISDLHLGDGTPSDAFRGKDEALTALVHRVRDEGAMLVVAGDALDIPQAWTITRILKAHAGLLSAMSELARDGRLIYIVGNHDHDISLYRELLHFRVCDALHIGDRVLVTHGHEHDPYIGRHLEGSDIATRVHHLTERTMGTWIRMPLGEFYNWPNRVSVWLAHKLGLASLGMRALGAALGVKGAGERTLAGLDYWARCNMGDPMCLLYPVMSRLRDGPWEWQVCGHSHLPGVVPHPSDRDKAYVNLGSWTFDSAQYAVWDGQRMVVRDWLTGRSYGAELYEAALSGALDEKDFWQWWRENYMGLLRFREGEERLGALAEWRRSLRRPEGPSSGSPRPQRALPAPPLLDELDVVMAPEGVPAFDEG